VVVMVEAEAEADEVAAVAGVSAAVEDTALAAVSPAVDSAEAAGSLVDSLEAVADSWVVAVSEEAASVDSVAAFSAGTDLHSASDTATVIGPDTTMIRTGTDTGIPTLPILIRIRHTVLTIRTITITNMIGAMIAGMIGVPGQFPKPLQCGAMPTKAIPARTSLRQPGMKPMLATASGTTSANALDPNDLVKQWGDSHPIVFGGITDTVSLKNARPPADG
jgi:hypothetical protein